MHALAASVRMLATMAIDDASMVACSCTAHRVKALPVSEANCGGFYWHWRQSPIELVVVRTTSWREGVLHGWPRVWSDRTRVYTHIDALP